MTQTLIHQAAQVYTCLVVTVQEEAMNICACVWRLLWKSTAKKESLAGTWHQSPPSELFSVYSGNLINAHKEYFYFATLMLRKNLLYITINICQLKAEVF